MQFLVAGTVVARGNNLRNLYISMYVYCVYKCVIGMRRLALIILIILHMMCFPHFANMVTKCLYFYF